VSLPLRRPVRPPDIVAHRSCGDDRRVDRNLAVRLSELELTEYWCDADPMLRGRLGLPIHTGSGAASTAVIYFEHEPGEHHGRHTDSAEEVMLVLEGQADVEAADERLRLEAGALALVPATVPHDIHNVGKGRLRAVGFFSSAAVVSHFDETLSPFGRSMLTLGAPDEVR
jgi:mannose-6-phosphate isomerase-like protein (cupin superfamily)